MVQASTPVATIVHPTDFSSGGASALAHSVKLALGMKARLCLLRVRGENDVASGPSGFRVVRDLLVRWKALGEEANSAAMEQQLGLSVSSVTVPARNARAGILDYLDSHPCDLVVIATHPHKRIAGWFDGSAQQGLLRKARVVSLFLRDGYKGVVNLKTGALALNRVLVPVDGRVLAIPALRRLEASVMRMSPGASFRFVHVGERAPRIVDDKGVAFDWPMELRQGSPVDAILECANASGADLIAMPTATRHGLLDALRGSTTAEVLEDARWPLIALPAD